ncbi:ArsC family reductase [Algibacillus agarilyticus]|uniref:ArsC family reductase n=1 Tax=Algibacillus agarilyticus TaxID=2234133 RepID=UPI000DCFA241|nr:ArsC family reductase [Algibacillus agarilyticus]
MTVLYGIKNCDSVKKAKKWLTASDVDFKFHDFRVEGLSAEKIEFWLQHVDLSLLLNKRGTTYRQLSDEIKDGINEGNVVSLFLENPTLIKRPVLETNNEVIVGFKADDYQARF